MTKQPVISFDDVSFAYQNQAHRVLKNATFNVSAGEFLGIIGPNGGGKTTLLKLIMGFLKPIEGQIHIFGQSPTEARRNIAYVPQSLRYDRQFPISVFELILSGRLSHLSWYGKYSQKDRQIAFEMLEKVGLNAYKDVPFGTLSGGEAQRALIARALASEPQILLLDEPTASVDAQAEANICSFLQHLKGKMTILMVTHDLKTIIRDVERVICVQNEIYSLQPQEVCEHFALGLYHVPLIQMPSESKP
jgi:zinc transport system ATP-binding protein